MFEILAVISPLINRAFSSLVVDSYSPSVIVVDDVISFVPLYVIDSL